MFSRFIWSYKRPRRALRFITLPKDRGGLALPNFKLYYWATTLRYCIELLLIRTDYRINSNIPTPQELILGDETRGCLWRHLKDSYFKKVRFKTISGIYKVWNNVRKTLGIGRLSYYTPIVKNNNLPEIFRDTCMDKWVQGGVTQLGCFYSTVGLKSFEKLQNDYKIGYKDFFKFLQVRDFMWRKRGGGAKFQAIQTMEKLLKNTTITIGEVYETMNASYPDDIDKCVLKWQSTRGVSAETVRHSYEVSQSCLMSTKLQAQYYKTFFSLYYMPYKIAKWGTGKGTSCPRCVLFEADIVHIFASCNVLRKLINDISSFLSEILYRRIEIIVEEIILGIANINRPKYMQGLIFVAMAGLRLCIASAWLDPNPPAFQQGRARLLAICSLEVAIYKRKARNKHKRGLAIWDPLMLWMQSQNGTG